MYLQKFQKAGLFLRSISFLHSSKDYVENMVNINKKKKARSTSINTKISLNNIMNELLSEIGFDRPWKFGKRPESPTANSLTTVNFSSSDWLRIILHKMLCAIKIFIIILFCSRRLLIVVAKITSMLYLIMRFPEITLLCSIVVV